MSTDPISEARREFEAWVWPGTVEMRTMTDAELDAAKDTAFAHLRAAILASDPRRAALETALKWQPLTSDINDWWEDEGSKSLTYEQYAGFVSGFKYGVHGLREVIRAALKALEETAVEETRS